MSSLIDSLFNKSQADAIRNLWKDKESRLLLQQEIGKKLIEDERVFDDLPLTQIMFITTLSPFASSTNECHNIAEVIYWGFHHTDILPLITEHKGKDLAYRCLISLGMFNEAMEKRCQRHGAPSPKFYRQIGVRAFNDIKMPEVSNHFYNWENFLREFFTL